MENRITNETIQQFSGMINKLINKYKREYNVSQQDLEDLEQEVEIAIIEAERTFDESENVKFITYAYNKADIAIKEYISRNVSCKLTKRRKRQISEYKKVCEDYRNKNFCDPPDTYILDKMQIKDYQLKKIKAAVESQISYNLDFVKEQLVTPSAEEVFFEKYTKEEEIKALYKYLLELSKIEQNIILEYFIERKTQKKIAEELEISVARVCQIKSRALKKLEECFRNEF